MLTTPAGAELLQKAAAMLADEESAPRDAHRCIAPLCKPLCKPLNCCGCNCAVPADVYAVLMRETGSLRDENAWLRAALVELLACHTEAAGWTASMMEDRAEFDAMLARSSMRLKRAVDAARVALGPNVELSGPNRPHRSNDER